MPYEVSTIKDVLFKKPYEESAMKDVLFRMPKIQ